MSFRTIITDEVKRQGLSGYKLAQLSGLPMRTVQVYLAGTTDLTGERLGKLCHALGLELRRRSKPTKGRKRNG